MSRAEVERVRANADFRAIAGGLVELSEFGQRLVGRCPFHGGEDASFAVDVDQKRYRCLECDAAGDVFRFVQDTHGLDFDAAVVWVARQSAA